MTGKQKCDLLKQIRREIAEANGIVYLSADCNNKGDCPGFCPKCDAEVRYLDSELNRLASSGKQITIAGLCISTLLESIDACTTSQAYDVDDSRMSEIVTERGEDTIQHTSQIGASNDRDQIMYEGWSYSIKDRVLAITLEELDLSVRSFNCLSRAGIKTVADIYKLTEDELYRVTNLGKKSAEEVLQKLKSLGITLRTEDE